MKATDTPTLQVKADAPGFYTILTGEAPKPLLPPAKLGYTGRLDTPRLFLTPKAGNYNPLQCTFEVDAEKDTVRFIGTEKSQESADVITGRLTPGDAIGQFKLNTGERWTIPALIELVKRMRPHFASQEQQVELITRLRNWNVSVTKQFEEVSKLDGNARRSVAVQVEGAAPAPFKLSLPIYKGYPKETVEVEFGVDAESSTGVKLYMDSPLLLDLMLTKKEEYLKTETDYFEAFGCSVIYIS